MRRAALVLVACATAAPPPRVLQVNRPGENVGIARAVVPGYVTVVDFWSADCQACTQVAAQVEPALAAEPRVVIRRVDVGDGVTPVARAYEITALPHYNVYDRRGHLRHVLVGSDCLQAPALAHALASE